MELLKVDIQKANYEYNDKSIIGNISFSLYSGELVGIIGPNGAGKSTTIKSILGLIPEFEGSIQFYDEDVTYAYIPEQPVYYEDLTLWEHIQLTASLCNISETETLARIEPLLDRFRLTGVKHQFPSTFSKGMQQKLMIVLAFMVKPKIYIVDEPFIGLDPKAMNDFLYLLNIERKNGAAVLLSTHMLDMAERICDRFLLLSYGHLVAQGKLEEIKANYNLHGSSLYDCFEKLLDKQVGELYNYD